MILNNISIILCRPQLGENIGAAARAMKNFGLSDLRIISPRDGWPNEKAEAMSVGAKDILNNANLFNNIEDALSDVNLVYATTARKRGIKKLFTTPSEASLDIIDKISNNQKIALLFGNEANGLSNEEVSHANAAISIPVSEEYASLNLAQAIVICCYEIFKNKDINNHRSEFEKNKNVRESTEESLDITERSDINTLMSILEKRMDDSNFYSVPEKKEGMMINIRNMFTNKEFTKQEIRTLIGILK